MAKKTTSKSTGAAKAKTGKPASAQKKAKTSKVDEANRIGDDQIGDGASPDQPKPYDGDLIMRAFTEELASVGWALLDPVAVASRAGIEPAEMLRYHDTKGSLLRAFQEHIDAALLAQTDMQGDPSDAEETVRDRLFDILMQRFDLLEPHKDGLIRLARDLPRDPLAFLSWGQRLRQSMAWILASAGDNETGGDGGYGLAAGLGGNMDRSLCLGLTNLVQTKALLSLWLLTARVWETDDSPDLSKTMAALDKNLARAEEAALMLEKLRARRF